MSEAKLLTSEQAKELKTEVSQMLTAQSKVTLKTAEVLYRVYHSTVKQNTGEVPLWSAWGFESFEEFAEEPAGLDMHMGTAKSLVSLYEELFVRHEFAEGLLPDSITKLRQLAKVSKKMKDTQGMKKWIGRAREMTCCDFQAAVDKEFGTGTPFKPFNFRLKMGEYPKFAKRLRAARDSFAVHSNGEAMAMILDEWWQTHQSVDRVRAKAR
jgi:hypothetical protein